MGIGMSLFFSTQQFPTVGRRLLGVVEKDFGIFFRY